MEIETTRTYYFTEEEMLIIYAFCQIADDVAIFEGMDCDNQNYPAEKLFCEKYKEYIKTGKCSSSFRVSD